MRIGCSFGSQKKFSLCPDLFEKFHLLSWIKMSASTAVKAIKKAKKAPKIVKKRTKTFFRFQSDRFDRVKVCDVLYTIATISPFL